MGALRSFLNQHPGSTDKLADCGTGPFEFAKDFLIEPCRLNGSSARTLASSIIAPARVRIRAASSRVSSSISPERGMREGTLFLLTKSSRRISPLLHNPFDFLVQPSIAVQMESPVGELKPCPVGRRGSGWCGRSAAQRRPE